MKIAVIGTGISGLVAAYLLGQKHDITVFEAAGYVGGHTNTIRIGENGSTRHVDTGFVVFNRNTYPNFSRLIDRLGVQTQPSCMSFSVRCDDTGLEYCGHNLNALFAQRRNLLRPKFYGLVRDILRFYRDSADYLGNGRPEMTLGQFMEVHGYGRAFIRQHLVPMASAIWSARPGAVRDFPLRHFLSFFDNHGFLRLKDQPLWETIRGGSQRYVEQMSAAFRDRVRLSSPVASIRRFPDRVVVTPLRGEPETFEHVVLAVHSDQALRLLADAGERERDILEAIPYQSNDTVLHTDSRMLPRRRRARASWNYHLQARADRPEVTYYMNRLQALRGSTDYCVTLNRRDRIDKDSIVFETIYDHPVLSVGGVEARARRHEISGHHNRTSFCGAYWGYGFHEDGVNSGLAVAAEFGERL